MTIDEQLRNVRTLEQLEDVLFNAPPRRLNFTQSMRENLASSATVQAFWARHPGLLNIAEQANLTTQPELHRAIERIVGEPK